MNLRTKFLDYYAHGRPKTKHFCIKCQRDITGPYRTIRVSVEAQILHPDDYGKASEEEYRTESVGMDCARRIGHAWSVPGMEKCAKLADA